MLRLVLLASLVCPTVVRAADKDTAKPNTLTPKEIADGWLLLFDGESTFGWEIDGDARAHGGALILGGRKPTKARVMARFPDLELVLECNGTGEPTLDIGKTEFSFGKLTGQRIAVNVRSELRNASERVTRVDGLVRYTVSATVPTTSDLVLRFDVPADGKLTNNSLRLRPLGLKTIFNGKDLTGWKEFPGRKSKFSVTPEGWLHLKDGPGDLQTEGKWGNFVLQLECRTNGDGLNSGIFFRCRPNEYQNGYEAQIHNVFGDPPGKEYTLDVFDPVTHELKEKKKERYTATDYGTGAIYRRQPARKQAAKDREWFAMTVLARGNRFGVWVNGIMVTDWTDNRPANDNARNGYRQEAGHISLQGHDPTTDLHFRNIRIAELSRPATP